MDYVFKACMVELEKRAVSAASTLKLLQGRAAQGARIAPAMMQRAEQAAASGMSRTAPTMRRMALESGDAARLQQRTQALAPVKSGLQNRIQQADAMGQNAFGTQALRHHDAFTNTHAYNQAHIDTVAGTGNRVSDPHNLMTPRPAPAPAPGATRPVARTAPAVTAGAAPTKITPRRLASAIDPHAATMISGAPQMTGITRAA